MKRILMLVSVSLFSLFSLKAQLEVAHLTTKGFSGTGFGGFLNVAVPIGEGSAITGEFGLDYFKHADNSITIVPVLLGYRYMVDGSETGWYIEPSAGYTIGATDIEKSDASGYPLYKDNGDPLIQKAAGVTGGLASGYIFPGWISFNSRDGVESPMVLICLGPPGTKPC